jgi:hypothetical protein
MLGLILIVLIAFTASFLALVYGAMRAGTGRKIVLTVGGLGLAFGAFVLIGIAVSPG